MPFSLLLQGCPTSDIPVAHVQGPALQGMFLHLIREVDPAVSERLHHEDDYRPYTLSPLGIGTPDARFDGFRLSGHQSLRSGTPCYVRITMLVDDLFPTFGRYFLERSEPTFRLGETEFVVTGVMQEQTTHPSSLSGGEIHWTQYLSYAELINNASQTDQKISLNFLTPTSFRRGRVDVPLPEARLVFQSYRKRFEEFYSVAFLPDFVEQVEYHTGIANLKHLETRLIKTKKVSLLGFTGRVTYKIDRRASPDLIFQMNLLANFAFFGGTGKKTTVGMGQTVRSA